MRRIRPSLWILVLAAGLSGCVSDARPAAAGPYRGRVIDAEEVLTDSRGQFSVGARPPRATMPGTRVSRPDITILKPGYAPQLP
jgi:hypothetical protein